jgi:hypothetical protein
MYTQSSPFHFLRGSPRLFLVLLILAALLDLLIVFLSDLPAGVAFGFL